MEQSRRTSTRQAGWLFVAAGVLTIVNNLLPGGDYLDKPVLYGVGMVAALIGAVVFLLPWDRWPARTTLAIPPVALALIAAGDRWGGVSAYSYAVFFVVVFMWVGLSQPPGTSFALAPLATVAYVLPGIVARHPTAGAVWSFPVAIPVCVLVAETVARSLSRVHRQAAALREAEERLRLSFDNAPIGKALVTPDGRFLRVNHALCDIVGYPAEALLTKAFQDITHPDDLDADLDFVRKMLAGEIRTYSMEKRYLHADGHVVGVNLSVSLVRDEQDSPLYFIAQIEDITDRKRTEAALREAQERFRLAFANAPIGMALTSLDGQFQQVNSALCDMLDRRPDELVGMTVPSLTHPDDRAADRAAMLEMRAGQRSAFATEKRYLRADGGVVWVRLHAAVVLDEHDQPMYFVSQMENITARRAAETALRESEERFRLLAEHASDLIIRSAPDGTIRYVSPACRHILGYEPAEMVGRLSQDFVVPDDRDISASARARVLDGDLTTIAVTGVRKKDGTTVILEATGHRVIDPRNGEPVEVQAICRDVTSRIQAERALLASEERTRRILETAGDAFVAMNARGTITAWNRQAETTFGWTAVEVVGRPLAEVLIPDDYRPAHQDGLQRFLATGEGPVLNEHLTLEALHRDGHRVPVELVIWAVQEDGESVFNAFLRDITERKAMEEELQRLATMDDLTGLRNRRGFLAVAEPLARMAHRNHANLTLLFIDLDNLKQINDRYGHVSGDHALMKMAELLTDSFRESDVIARLGGDEFAVLIAHEGTGITTCLERLHTNVAERNAKFPKLSFSLGMAEYRWDRPCPIEALIDRADTAMYQEKARKRQGASTML